MLRVYSWLERTSEKGTRVGFFLPPSRAHRPPLSVVVSRPRRSPHYESSRRRTDLFAHPLPDLCCVQFTRPFSYIKLILPFAMPADSISLNAAAADDPPALRTAPNHHFSSSATFPSDDLNFRREGEASSHGAPTDFGAGHPSWFNTNKPPAPNLKLSIPKQQPFTRSKSLSSHWRPVEDTSLVGTAIEGVGLATRGQVVLGEAGFGAGYFSVSHHSLLRLSSRQKTRFS